MNEQAGATHRPSAVLCGTCLFIHNNRVSDTVLPRPVQCPPSGPSLREHPALCVPRARALPPTTIDLPRADCTSPPQPRGVHPISSPRVFEFDNTYAAELEGLYTSWQGGPARKPAIVILNHKLAQELGVDASALDTPAGAAMLAGSDPTPGASPLAQAYAGHQFGSFNPQLGDGRALLLGELIDVHGKRRDIQLKGSGPTPYSRGGDGRAAIGPILREYLVGEFMHTVGIPTTRALAAVLTGETVYREDSLPGAVLTRVASSHIRVGTFQIFAARGENEKLKRLADYTIQRHLPEIADVADPYLALLRRVVDRQATLVAKWMSIGFVHGVMNTDNTTISGETIDYGPCAFMDEFDSKALFSSIDRGGRYAYDNQPPIAQWNLSRFAETLLVLMDPEDPGRAIPKATGAVEEFGGLYEIRWMAEVRAKLGLKTSEANDRTFIAELHAALDAGDVDYTSFFRRLAAALRGDESQVNELSCETSALRAWIEQWMSRHKAQQTDPLETAAAMDRINPVYIPRNHKVEEALDAATRADYAPFKTLHQLLSAPYTPIPGQEEYATPAPSDFGPYQTFCGT